MANFYGLIYHKDEATCFISFPSYKFGLDFIACELCSNIETLESASLYKTNVDCKSACELIALSVSAKEKELLVTFDNFFIAER